MRWVVISPDIDRTEKDWSAEESDAYDISIAFEKAIDVTYGSKYQYQSKARSPQPIDVDSRLPYFPSQGLSTAPCATLDSCSRIFEWRATLVRSTPGFYTAKTMATVVALAVHVCNTETNASAVSLEIRSIRFILALKT